MRNTIILDNNATYFEEYAGMTFEAYCEEFDIEDIDEYEVLNDSLDSAWSDHIDNIKGIITNKIVGIADLGFWNGRKTGCKEINTLREIFYTDCDFYKWEIVQNNLRATLSHHDGTNYVLYREFKDFVDWEQEQQFYEHCLNGTLTKGIINYYTQSLAPIFAELYGL